jgi:signal transduction histidine kinase
LSTSIRWRLAAAFALVTLVAVLALGTVALALVSSIAESRELADLRTNAETVAAQAVPALVGAPQSDELAFLARTSAFLGDRRVRIYGPDSALLVDTGPVAASDQLVWMESHSLGPNPHFWLAPAVEVVGPFPADNVVAAGSGALGTDGEGRVIGARPRTLRVGRLPGPHGSRLSLKWSSGNGEAADTELAGWPQHPQAEQRDPAAPAPLDPAFLSAPASERSVRVAVGDPGAPAGFVELSGGPDLTEQTRATAQRAISVAAATATVLAGALGLVFSRSLTSPLSGLARTANQMESGDLTARVALGGPSEIDSVARAFNGMASSLEATVSALAADRDALSRFVADASHQLRTPITALTTYLELAGQNMGAEDPGAMFVRESAREVARLDWVTSNLLALSRLDSGVTRLLVELVEAKDLCHAAAAPFRERAVREGKSLELGCADGVIVSCDRAHVEMALGNLVDNALKHTARGEEIIISASANAQQVVLAVADTGAGFGGADLERVFERFYRGPDVTGVPGAGLGLAVVRAVAEAHGGECRALERSAGGSEVQILLPLAPVDSSASHIA